MTKHAKPDPAPPDSQAKPKSEQPSGGIAFDERGNAIWKWRSDIDTQQVKAIQESSEASFSIDEPAKQPVIMAAIRTVRRRHHHGLSRKPLRRLPRRNRSEERWMTCAG